MMAKPKPAGKASGSEKQPERDDVERMYRVAYLMDPAFFRREDVVDFGVDLHRLKEFGEVRMGKPLTVIRKNVHALWKRMNDEQRSAFMIGEVISRLNDVTETLRHLEAVMGDAPDVHEFVEFARGNLLARIPVDLGAKLGRGSGKWRAGAT